ncbi:sensor histidine kinase [Archangium lipolyticum]|uniref:sensor histidine kinase n=1 Tax=Archangium lipolyticum TaxID=2970465 RepID=UPI00214A274A|nr:ATP-binding protein [Archangium lipolyticum]
MSGRSSHHPETQRSVSERLKAHKETIIHQWMDRVRQAIPAARAQDESQLRNDLPKFLGRLVTALAPERFQPVSDEEPNDLSRDQGQQRSNLEEYSLHQMLREYQFLREVIFQVLEREGPIPPTERDIILSAIEQGMAEAVERFMQLVQSRERAIAAHLRETDQIEARGALEESEARFRLIANALPQIIWTATSDFFVDWYNDWWFKYLGLPRGTRWDDPDTQPMHPEDVERTRPRLREAVETGNDFFMEQRFRRGSDGQYRWHLVRGVPIRGPDGRIVKWVGANTDIHDLKTATAHLEEERDLRERFVATLTHDLRTPLTAAKLNAHMLARKGSDPAVLYKLAARISENLDRADRMIRDLLDANRIRAGVELPLDVSECDLSALAREILEELSLVHGDRFVLSARHALQGYWSCSGMRRIIENLCNNAIKYGARDHPVTVSVAQNGPDEVSVSVHNWGPPIPPEDQKLLFQQYRRMNSAQKGWGLGLTLVEGLAKAHRGTVRVESTRETGTTFTVTVARDMRR